jgi:flagellin
MSTVINTNLASLYAQNNLSNAQNNLAQSVMRLSSGLRINGAKDDAAGLAISQNMQSQINGVNQSIRNLSDATNLIQVAETSMSTVHDMLLRMKQLAVQGYNGSLSSSQRGNLVDELIQLNTEINNTADRTEFNGNKLIANENGFDASASTLKLRGASNATLLGAHTNTDVTLSSPLAQTYTFSQVGGATSTLVKLTGDNGDYDTATVSITAVGTNTYNFANLGITLTMTTSNTETNAYDVAADLAGKTIEVGGTDATQLDFQAGPSYASTNFITYLTTNIKTDGSNGSENKMNLVGTAITGDLTDYRDDAIAGTDTLNTTWRDAFLALTTKVDNAIGYISDQRSILGAQINRIAYITTNLQAQSTNLQSSRSAIMDTDFAAETAKLTKGQIMQQAATAMLAQANQMPNVVLSLLK